MAWTGIGCLILFINSIVWHGNAINWAPVYCDIATKFIIGMSIGIPTASLCINRRLYHISSVRTVTTSKADVSPAMMPRCTKKVFLRVYCCLQKRRAILVDLGIGLGIPVIYMIFRKHTLLYIFGYGGLNRLLADYINQGHRFNIYEDVGCYPYTFNTTLAVALVFVPPILVGMVSAVYCVLSIRSFAQTRAQFNELMNNSSHRNLSGSRYMRLMLLAGLEVLCTVPLGIYNLCMYITAGYLYPWQGWAVTHKGFQRVDQFPAILWKNDPIGYAQLEGTRWTVVACAIVFFAFFGFADEAIKNYRSAIRTVSKTFGLSTAGSDTLNNSKGWNGSSGAKLPSFVRRDVKRRSSFDSDSTSDEKKNKFDERIFNPDFSYGGLEVGDIGGFLNDSAPKSAGASSSASSILSTPIEIESPVLPPAAVTRPRSQEVDIISVRPRSLSPTITTVPIIAIPIPPTRSGESELKAERANTPDMV